jgi:IS4 transposase
MRVLKSVSKQAVLVFWILEVILCARSSPRVKFSELNFLSVLALLEVWLLVFRQSFGNGIGD